MTQHQTLDTQILQLIVAMFNAAPGAVVLTELRSALAGGESVEALTRNLVRTDVFRSLYPDSLDAVEFSARFALNVLEAEVGPSQMAYAIRELTAFQREGLDRAQTVLRAIDALLAVAPANPEWGNARQAFENKLTVAAYFSVEKQKSAQTLEELQSVVQPVTSNPCSVEGAIGQIDGLATGPVILAVTPGLHTDTGVNSTVDAGGITRDNTVGIAGTVSDAGSVTTVEVLDGALVLGTATVAANGEWRFTTTVLADGEHALSVRTVGATCDTVSSSPIVFTVDTTAPMFAAGASTSVNVAENTATTTTVHSATASDTVAVTDYTFDASGADNARFSLNTTTGALSFKTSPNFEAPGSAAGSNSYTVKIRAIDTAGNSAGQTVTVNVTDVNEHAPVFTSGATGSVAENAATTTAIYTATSTDADGTPANRGVVYSLKAGGDAALLDIDAGSGAVTLRSSADFEAKSSYSFTVLATNGSLVTEQPVSVSVTDEDEFDVAAPTDANTATNEVTENAVAGTVVGITAHAADADASTNTVTYSFTTAGNPEGLFAIGSSSGIVTTAAAINRETHGASRNITVLATSADGSTATSTFSIAIGDVDEFDVSAPTDADTTADGISENVVVGTAVGITARASDDDATANVVRYAFTDDGNPDGLFAIDSTTGVITTAAAINRETHGASRSITVLATSADGSTNKASFTIAINNDATETRTLSVGLINGGGTVSLVENTPTASDTAVVARLRATGEAATFAPGVLSWHLVAVDENSKADVARFSLGTDGTLRFNAANYEEAFQNGRRQEGTESTDNDYTVAVVLRDIDGNASSQTVVRVQVRDDDDEAVLATQSIAATDVVTVVNEHTGSGAASAVAVAQLTLTNAIGLAHWSLRGTATAAGFSVSATGLVAFTPPDREASEFNGRDINDPDDWVFTALVTGIDDDGNEVEHTVSVSLNDVAEGEGLNFKDLGPTDATVSVAESTALPAATPVKVLSLEGAIGTVTWELSGADKDRFQIGADGISVYLVSSNFEAGWVNGTRSAGHDADDNDYTVTVKATDREGWQIERTFDVDVTDVTERPTGTGVADLTHTSKVGTDGNVSVNVDITESTAPTLLGTPVFTGAIGAVTWRVLGRGDGREAEFDEEDVTVVVQ